MKFADIQAAYLLWLAVFLVGFYFWAFKSRKKTLGKFTQSNLLSELTASLDSRKRRLKILLISSGVLFCLLALIRPQWGFQWEEVKRRGLDILIAIDTSKSMLAEDVRPNRLERSKLAVKDLVKKLKGDRVGLIAFAGKAFLQCPLTLDYNGFMLSLDSLGVDSVPKGGTSVSSAINTALNSYEGGLSKYKILIIITDGEDHKGKVIEAARQAKAEGIKIFSVGIGTREGELIPFQDEAGRRTYLKDREGNFVKSRLDEKTLQEAALITGGSYVKAAGAEFGLDLIYSEKLSKLEKKEFAGSMRKRYEERFQIPLLLGLLLLVVEPLIRERKRQQ